MVSVSGYSQRVNQPPVPTAPSMLSKPSMSSFFDINKFEMHHSYSMSVSSFGGGNNFSEGMYTNTLLYRFDAPAVMRMDIGVLHDPFGTQKFGNNSNNAQLFLKNLSIDYKPTSNTVLSLGFRQIPFSVNSMYNSYSRYRYSPFLSDPFSDDFNSNGW